jgi:hypothetical protein
MPRPLTPAIIAALTGQQTDEVFVVLVTFTYKTTVFRFSSDPTVRHSVTPLIYKTVSNGLDYYYVPMSITLPNETIDSPANAQLSVSNVGLELISILRSMTVGDVPAKVDMNLVLASAPNTIGYNIPTMDMVQADWDENSVNLTLNIESLDREPFPSGNFDPSWFPALF